MFRLGSKVAGGVAVKGVGVAKISLGPWLDIMTAFVQSFRFRVEGLGFKVYGTIHIQASSHGRACTGGQKKVNPKSCFHVLLD